MDNRDYFNTRAERWDSMVSHDEKKIRDILKLIDIKKGSRVLDVGTGTGVMIPYLLEDIGNSGSILAVDKAEEMIIRARKKFSLENVSFIAEDIFTMPLEKNYFDCIMCYSVLPHFEEKESAVSYLAKLLRHGGSLAVCHSQSRDAINRFHRCGSEAINDAVLPTAEEMKYYFKQVGLTTTISVDNEEMFVIVGKKE